MVGRVVGGAVLPAVPDGVEPGAGQDAHGVGVVVSSGDGAVVAVGGPEVGSAAVTGEVADGVAELFVLRAQLIGQRNPVGDEVFAGAAGPAQGGRGRGVGQQGRSRDRSVRNVSASTNASNRSSLLPAEP